MSRPNETQAEDTSNSNELRLYIPKRYLVLSTVCGATGLTIGFVRGSRAEGMRFLAENAHRPPTTLRGWYLYKKTKNYRMLWGGLKEGGRHALKLGAIGTTFAACEDGMSRTRFAEAREAGAGFLTAVVVCAVYRLPIVQTRRAVLMGGIVGATMSLMRRAQDRLLAGAGREERAGEGAESVGSGIDKS